MTQIIKDIRGNLYAILDVRRDNTLLRCVKTNAHVIIRNHAWHDLGFIKP